MLPIVQHIAYLNVPTKTQPELSLNAQLIISVINGTVLIIQAAVFISLKIRLDQSVHQM